jgi:hypothetical protein
VIHLLKREIPLHKQRDFPILQNRLFITPRGWRIQVKP